MSPEDCDACHGQRLKPEILAITLGDTPAPNRNPNLNPSIPGLSIMDVCGFSIDAADEFFANLKLPAFEEKIAAEIIKESVLDLAF
jgi:excinuclease ABC subunit A